MEETLSAPPTKDGEDKPNENTPHWLIGELAGKTGIPAETLTEYGLGAKPDATIPKQIRDREPHLPRRVAAVVLPLIPLAGEARRASTYRAADKWRTSDGKSVKWHSRCRIGFHHLVIAPGGQPTWERPLALAEGLTDTLTAHHTILLHNIDADVVGAPGAWRAAATAAVAARRGVACFLLLDNDGPSRKAAKAAIDAYYRERSPDDGGVIVDVGSLLPEKADITDIGPETLSHLIADAPPAEWEPPPDRPNKSRENGWEEHSDHWVASDGEPNLMDEAPRYGAAHWHYRNSLGLRVHLNCVRADLRYNIRAHRYEMLWDSDLQPSDIPAEWCEMTDKRRDALFDIISIRGEFYTLEEGDNGFRRRYRPAEWRGAVRDEAINALTAAVDPFVTDYLQHLPEWNGVPRLATLLHSVFSVDPETPPELVEWAVASVFGVAIARALTPEGYDHHETPVLVGPQDCGKSSFWASLVPRAEWFAGNVPLCARHDGDKKYVESVMGRVIGCCGELAGIGKAEIEDVKRRMALPAFSHRLPFRRNPEQVIVRHALVGDTNNKECLPNDPTGNRRWVPVEVDSHPDRPPHMTPLEWARAIISPIRDQLWAEALHRWNAGERPHLPQALKDVAREHAVLFRTTDELAEDWVASKVAECERQRNKVRLTDLASAPDIPKDLNDRRIRKALRTLGYGPRNANGERWWEPELDPSALVRLSAPASNKDRPPHPSRGEREMSAGPRPDGSDSASLAEGALGALSRTEGITSPPPTDRNEQAHRLPLGERDDPKGTTAAARRLIFGDPGPPRGAHDSDF